jgi:serine/threonine protein phosphatase PrpC
MNESSSSTNIRSGRSSTLPIQAACASDVGRVRENNEDNFFLGLEEGLFIVSDGMGGHQSGEIASNIVVDTLPRLLLNSLKETWARGKTINYPSLVKEAVIELNNLVNRKALQETDLRGMGATLALAWVTDGRGTVFLANVGDSRVYDLRDGSINQLTRDHSIVAILLAQGEITEEEASLHPTRGQLYRYIGMPEEAEADVHRIHLEPGGVLLLCSDGLTDELSDARIQSIISGHEELSAACQSLVDAAKESGGRDNITAMLLQWKKIGSST